MLFRFLSSLLFCLSIILPLQHAFMPTKRSSTHIAISSTESNTHFSQADILLSLEADWASLTKVRPPQPDADISFPVDIVSEGSSYTRIWTHQTWSIHSHPPHRRYFRHVRKWIKSSTAKKILPSVLLASCWSVCVSLLSKFFQLHPLLKPVKSMTAGTASAVSLLSAPLALLLTLRANASLARLMEARQAWGRLVLHTRGLSSILANHVFPVSPQAADLSVRYLSLLGWVLKGQLRGENQNSQKQLFELMLTNSSEREWIMAQPKKSVALLSRIRQICCLALASSPASTLKSGYNQLYFVEEKIAELEACVGSCERLFGSPIPPTYTRHLSRVMSLWLVLLPMSLVFAASLNTLAVAFVVSIGAYVFVGLDEVGMEIENVFRLLPLQQLAAAAQKDAQDQFLMIGDPPTVQ